MPLFLFKQSFCCICPLNIDSSPFPFHMWRIFFLPYQKLCTFLCQEHSFIFYLPKFSKHWIFFAEMFPCIFTVKVTHIRNQGNSMKFIFRHQALLNQNISHLYKFVRIIKTICTHHQLRFPQLSDYLIFHFILMKQIKM